MPRTFNQKHTLTRWDHFSTNTPVTRAMRRYLKETRRPARGLHWNASAQAIRLRGPFGAVIRLVPRVAALLVLTLSLVGCVSPVTAAAVQPPALHHNIPAAAPDGSIWYLCATQPRTYLTTVKPGVVVQSIERDHYLQRDLCPNTPID